MAVADNSLLGMHEQMHIKWFPQHAFRIRWHGTMVRLCLRKKGYNGPYLWISTAEGQRRINRSKAALVPPADNI